ncbi:protein transport protein Sec31A [Sinocyclocheilus grahami]|uniref:protein transport protein Sec31A n=1 Tax=Sinocyclocheilus grahami TaxID=75366 RepID=UPI0007AD2237|nr:PREDICTED: protein transport protein Sec31A [Sinocyclocheilus grahami]
MKLKEIKRTALQAWSPAQQHPIYLAAGTSAQQLDATFSTNASLEIFELDLSDPTLAMKSCGSFSSPHRYHKLVWGAHGIEDQSLPSGVLIAGGENGNIILYDASKIIAGDSEVIISQSEKHTGPVRALDVNSFQTNLVASGGNESEIYIWDLNNLSSPMTPGPKTQPLEDISCVAWNRQVQHILASASPSGKASVWDLRKNDLIIKVSDHSNRMHCSGLAWNPEVATQLVLASEDDRMPVIQMWDLRFATSPLKVLESHTRGVLAIAWSEADPELLLSCGKDNRILCWNPNTAEVLYELPTSTQWCFDIQWCPRNPAVLSAAAFDGNISIYSIMGGSNDDAITLQAEQLSSSFGNMDPFGTGKTLPPLQLPQTAPSQSTITPLKKPPKWIRRPVGASFAFGGKLVTLDNIKPAAQQPQQTAAHVVHISQVVTETDFLDRSNQLQATLTAGNFLEYCQNKTEAAQSEFEKTIWSFLKVNFEEDARGKYLELLGYKKEELALKIASALEKNCESDEADVLSLIPHHHPTPAPVSNPVPDPVSKPQLVLESEAIAVPAQPQLEPKYASPPKLDQNLQSVNEPLHEPTIILFLHPESDVMPPCGSQLPAALGLSSDILPPIKNHELTDLLKASDFRPVLDVEEVSASGDPNKSRAEEETPAEEVEKKSPAEEETEPPATETSDLDEVPFEDEEPAVEETSNTEVTPAPASDAINLKVSQDIDGLITQALLTGDYEAAVNLCLHDNRMADGIILAIAGGPELLAKTQKKYFTKTQSKISKPESDVMPPCGSQLPAALGLSSDILPPIKNHELTDLLKASDFRPVLDVEEVSASGDPNKSRAEEETPAEEVEKKSPAEEETEPPATETSDLDEVPFEDEEPAVEETSNTEVTPAPASDAINLKVSQDIDGLITQALLTGDYEAAVNLCLHDNRMADGIILAIAGGLLGSRLDATEDTALQAQACLCYICAGTVEQLVAYWAKAQDSSSPLALQELVEKVVVLQRAVLRAQGGVSPDMGALLAVKMNQYASLLASQGSLQTAISYLPTNTQQVAVQQLRDRLSRALGQQQHAVTGMQDMRQTLPAAAPVQTYTQPPQVPAAPPQYYQQGRSASTVTSWSNQTPTALPSVPHPLVPAADPQVESTAPAFGLQSPVSASVPASAAFMFSQQYQNYPQVQQFMPAAGTPGIYQPLQYSSSLASPLPPPPSAAAVYPPQFMHPASSQPAAPPVISGPPQGGQPFSPPPPLSSGMSFQHGGPGSPTAYLPPPVARAPGIQTEPALFPFSQRTGGLNQDSAWSMEGPQNGWNDPPALNRAPKKKKVPENFTPPAPITAPIMTPLGDPQVPAVQTMQTLQLQQQGPDQPVGPATFSPIQQQPLGPLGRNPSMPQGNMEGAPGAPIGDVIKPLQSIPSEKITKKPIPEEHMVLKTTFEGLIQKCLAAASDPQTKRKLDDAHKRLEYLYDKLREQTLSPAIVGGLHSMARSIECRCYTDGLNIHTHIVSSSNFSETSAFMPVLKVVLTQANKLAV